MRQIVPIFIKKFKTKRIFWTNFDQLGGEIWGFDQKWPTRERTLGNQPPRTIPGHENGLLTYFFILRYRGFFYLLSIKLVSTVNMHQKIRIWKKYVNKSIFVTSSYMVKNTSFNFLLLNFHNLYHLYLQKSITFNIMIKELL